MISIFQKMNNRTKKKEPLLRVENLTTQFKINEEWFSAVQEISFSIARSQVVGIIGESGCGKSVTAASLLRLLPARKARIQQGKFFFKGQEISHLSMDEFYPLRGKEISMIFQDPLSSLNPVLKIKEQLLEVWEKSQREVAFKKVKNLLHQVGLGDSERILQSYPHQLSGGMRQRIMIAMALSFEPDLLIADEPTTALDVTVQAQILYLLEKLQKEKQMSLLLITHDMAIIAQMCDLVYVMYAGRIVESGTVEQIFYSPAHPYTQGLLGSISYKNHKKKLPTIAGTVPALTDKTKGCPFFARCSQKEPRCNLKHPGFSKKQEGHLFACYNPR